MHVAQLRDALADEDGAPDVYCAPGADTLALHSKHDFIALARDEGANRHADPQPATHHRHLQSQVAGRQASVDRDRTPIAGRPTTHRLAADESEKTVMVSELAEAVGKSTPSSFMVTPRRSKTIRIMRRSLGTTPSIVSSEPDAAARAVNEPTSR